MAKLNKVKEEVNTTDVPAEETKAPVLYVSGEDDEKPSLNQLAIVLGIPAVRLQSAQVAYKPIEGLPYDPKRINWANISAFISRRLDKTDYATVEEVYAAALATEYTPRARFGRTGEGSTNKTLFGTTPVRKGDIKVGDSIYRKKDGAQFTVIFANDTITVYEPVHGEDEKVVSEAIGNRMFNMNFSLEPVAVNAATAEASEDAE